MRLRSLFHIHRYAFRETHNGVKVDACICGAAKPQIDRSEPLKFAVSKPAHEQLKALRQPAAVVRLPQRRRG